MMPWLVPEKLRLVFSLVSLLTVTSSLSLCAQAKFDLVKSEVVQARLTAYKGNDQAREKTMLTMFLEAGCPASGLTEQTVPRRREPNVICILPGRTDATILVGAHFDHVSSGDGVVDNWTGASLLPSLLQSLSHSDHEHTFVFVGFTGEEAGEVGSRFYVKQLSQQDVSKLEFMITIDTLGLSSTKVWTSRSDKNAVDLLAATAQALHLPLATMNVDNYGVSDEEAFIQRHVKTVMIHSVTPQTFAILHTKSDVASAVRFSDFYDSYHLLAAYLSVLDMKLKKDLQ